MKKILLLVLCALTTMGARAQDVEVTYPVITGLGSDKFIITVNDAGQIAGLNLTAEAYSALATATEIRVVTEGNVQLSSADMTRLCSSDFTMATLDLSGAQVAGATVNSSETNNLKKLNNAPSTLKNIVFPIQDGMWIPDQCFNGNSKIQSIIIPDYPDGKTYRIGSQAFANATGLLRASIGKGTSSLGGDPYETPDLTGKDMVTKDDEHPNGVTKEDLTLINGQPIFSWGVGEGVFSGCTNLYSLVLDDDITSIRNEAFSGCTSIEFIQLPKNLTALGNNSFANCSSVTTVVLPEQLRFIGQSIFQGMNALRDVYLLAEDTPLPFGGSQSPIFTTAQTNEFKYEPAGGPANPTYSQADYKSTQGNYTMAILHYPGTETARNNYRWPNHEYRLVDSDGTTWPDNRDIEEFTQYKESLENSNDIFKGWKYFLQGNMNEKRDDIYYITRFKTSRWYSVCFPFDLTVDKFQNAFGAQAALSEFVGFTYDIDGEKETMTIHFDVAALPNSNNVLLKANHAYMIHPSRLVDDDNPIEIYNVNNLMEHYRSAEVMARKLEIVEAYNRAQTALQAYIDDNYNGVEPRPHEETEDYRQLKKAKEDAFKLYKEWDKVLDDDDVDQYNEELNEEVWYTNEEEKYDDESITVEEEKYRIRRYPLPEQLHNDVTYYFRGNYIAAPTGDMVGRSQLQDKQLPAGCYYLGGVTERFFHRQVAGSKWTPFTAILDGKANSSNANPAKAISLSFSMDEIERVLNNEGGIATAIDKELVVRIPLKAAGNAYNMQGQLIGTHGTEGLPKGMYIVNGKKHVVK